MKISIFWPLVLFLPPELARSNVDDFLFYQFS